MESKEKVSLALRPLSSARTVYLNFGAGMRTPGLCKPIVALAVTGIFLVDASKAV